MRAGQGAVKAPAPGRGAGAPAARGVLALQAACL
jgi:hypothetical protein